MIQRELCGENPVGRPPSFQRTSGVFEIRLEDPIVEPDQIPLEESEVDACLQFTEGALVGERNAYSQAMQ